LPTWSARCWKKLGFWVDSALVSAEAKHLLDNGDVYDLVLAALNMPHMDGYELANWVKHYSKTTKVIIMAGCLRYEDLLRCTKKRVVDNWICKPFDSDELISVIRSVRAAKYHH